MTSINPSKAIRSIVTSTPAAVAQEILLKDLRALAAQATVRAQQISNTTDYVASLMAELSAVK